MENSPANPADSAQTPASAKTRSSVKYYAILLLLVAIQLTLSLAAVSGKSATFDEPLHTYAGWRSVVYRDLRLNPEHPPLWKYWAALPSRGLALGPADSEEIRSVMNELAPAQHLATRTAMWDRTDGAGAEAVRRGRWMMALLACGLPLVCATMARRLGGDLAGLLAAGLVALDPNLLAHGPLVTNDVPFTTVFVLVLLQLALVCDRLTVARVAGLGGVIALAMATKHSAVLLLPATGIVLAARVWLRVPWITTAGEMLTAVRRALAAAVCFAVVLAMTWAGVWASYGFRSTATSGGPRFTAESMINTMRTSETHARIRNRAVTVRDMQAWRPSLSRQIVLASDAYGVLPNPWNFGMAFVLASSTGRDAFLLGEHYVAGNIVYFPLAMAFKMPAPTLIVLATALFITLTRPRKLTVWSPRRWLVVVAAVVTGVYGLAAMTSAINIGLRHFFPIYVVLISASAGVIADGVRCSKVARIVTAGLGVCLAAGAMWAFPNYISYFNLPSRLISSPATLLGDSNIDWGQDLPLLARWQKEHPTERLYLAYSGMAEPGSYDVKATRAVAGYLTLDPLQPIDSPGVLAISASFVQLHQLLPHPQLGRKIFQATPREVLGGSIYLYDIDPSWVGMDVYRKAPDASGQDAR